MAGNKEMFVYYDDDYMIKCISPVEEDLPDYKFTVMDSASVAPLASGESPLSSYVVVQDADDISKFSIQRRKLEVRTHHVSFVNKFLFKVPNSSSDHFDLKLYDDPKAKTITVVLPTVYRMKLNVKPAETLNRYPVMQFYFTKNGDPGALLFPVRVDVAELLEIGRVIHDYTGFNTEDCSVFTKKIFKRYVYERQV